MRYCGDRENNTVVASAIKNMSRKTSSTTVLLLKQNREFNDKKAMKLQDVRDMT